jgi:hypothetical protein
VPIEVRGGGDRILWPRMCGCCGCAPGGTTLKVSTEAYRAGNTTQWKTFEVPYCSSCIKHVEAHSSEASAASVIVFFMIVLAFVVGSEIYRGGGDYSAYGLALLAVGWLVGIGAVGAYFRRGFYRQRELKMKKYLKTDCASPGLAVVVTGAVGLGHCFRFQREDFGRLVAELNVATVHRVTEKQRDSTDQILVSAYRESKPWRYAGVSVLLLASGIALYEVKSSLPAPPPEREVKDQLDLIQHRAELENAWSAVDKTCTYTAIKVSMRETAPHEYVTSARVGGGMRYFRVVQRDGEGNKIRRHDPKSIFDVSEISEEEASVFLRTPGSPPEKSLR